MATIGEPVTNGTAGSVLFVDSASKLAQDSDNFVYDPATNTLKSKDKSTSASADFRVSTGDATASQNYDSGSLTLETGDGGSNVTSAAAGSSGDLLLRTGDAGDSSTGAGGDAGSIILQPGSFGTGGTNGVSGSTLVRAPSSTSEPIFAVQNSDGGTNHWLVSSVGLLTGTNAINVTHSSTGSTNTLFVNGAGAKTDNFTAMNTGSTATSSTANKTKTALSVQSTGTWDGMGAENRALYANASGGPVDSNYAGLFDNGDVVLKNGRLGVQVLKPSARLHLAAGSADAGTAAFKLNSGAKLTTPEAGAIEFDGTQLWITQLDSTRRSLIPAVANVLDFGAKGDGSTDDSAAFQAAVNSLIETGGIVWVPPGRKYVVGNVTITAKYPVWIISGMMGHGVAGGAGHSHNNQASIVPKPGMGTTHIFKWERHTTAFPPAGFGQGGGLQGLVLNDITTDAAGNVTASRTTAIGTAAVWVDDATDFTIRDCILQYLKGTAIRVDESTFCLLRTSRSDACGDTDRPVIDLGGQATQAFVWTERLFIQDGRATHIRVQAKGGLWHNHAYHEDTGANKNTFVDGTSGRVICDGCDFKGTDKTSVILGQSADDESSTIANCRFFSAPGANPQISVLSTASYPKISNTEIRAYNESGPAIDCAAAFAKISDVYCINTGKINITGAYSALSDIYMYAPNGVGAGVYCIDFNTAPYGTLSGATIYGATTVLGHGVRIHFGTVTGVLIRQLAGTANGIVSTGNDGDTIVGNTVIGNAGGSPFVYTQGTKAHGNFGFAKTASATFSSTNVGTATLDAEVGTVITDSVSTAAGASYQLQLTNSLVATTSQIMASVDYGSGTMGTPIIGYVSSYQAGLALIEIRNIHPSAAFNGTYRIHFKVNN